RNSAAAEKSESESEGGQKTCPELVEGFLPPNPLPFCPPERSVPAARSAAISQDFVQKSSSGESWNLDVSIVPGNRGEAWKPAQLYYETRKRRGVLIARSNFAMK
ncbi:MAG: hypothetical protein AAB879_03580, partial [Patescibacteria group bacterium]